MSKNEYKKYRLNKIAGLLKYSVTLLVLAFLVVVRPDYAAQFTGYVGAFILGGSKIKDVLRF